MEAWLQLLIMGGCMFMLFLILTNGIIFVAEKRISKRNKIIEQLQQENAHKQQLLDAYGIKEINIGGEEDE